MLAEQTLMKLSFQLLDATTSRNLLAGVECLIGMSLLFKFKLHWIFPVFIFHMLMTFAPLFLFPELTFKVFPFAPNLEGQYIIKNVVMLAAVWIVLFPMVLESLATRPKLEVVVDENKSENKAA